MIIVCVRTLNEVHRIERFCESYKDADLIIVADGGSQDGTQEAAREFKNVWLTHFTERTELANGYWRNNDSRHANFLFGLAYDYKPDWIIYDDCDCVPNALLRKEYRHILETTDCDVVMAVRLYLWGLDQHFPRMAQPGELGKWETSLYAWRGNLDLWTINVPPAYDFRIGGIKVADFRNDAKTLEVFPPYVLRHESWDNAERVEKKIQYYRESGFISNMAHPLEFAGVLEPLPKWASYE